MFIPPELIMAGISKLAPILGGAAKSRGDAQTSNDQLNILRSNADVNRREYMRDSPGTRLKSAKSASMVANFKPTTIKLGAPGFGVRGETPQFEGGFNNPDMYSPDTKQLANEVIKNHLVAQMSGADNMPEIPQPGKSSTLDKILGGGAFGSSILGAFLKGSGGGSSNSMPELPNSYLGF